MTEGWRRSKEGFVMYNVDVGFELELRLTRFGEERRERR